MPIGSELARTFPGIPRRLPSLVSNGAIHDGRYRIGRGTRHVEYSAKVYHARRQIHFLVILVLIDDHRHVCRQRKTLTQAIRIRMKFRGPRDCTASNTQMAATKAPVGSYWYTHEQPTCCPPSINFFRLTGFTKTGLPRFTPLGKTETNECITPTRDPSRRYTGTHFGKVTAKLNPNVKNNNIRDRFREHSAPTKPIAARRNGSSCTLKSATLFPCPNPEQTLVFEWDDYR